MGKKKKGKKQKAKRGVKKHLKMKAGSKDEDQIEAELWDPKFEERKKLYPCYKGRLGLHRIISVHGASSDWHKDGPYHYHIALSDMFGKGTSATCRPAIIRPDINSIRLSLRDTPEDMECAQWLCNLTGASFWTYTSLISMYLMLEVQDVPNFKAQILKLAAIGAKSPNYQLRSTKQWWNRRVIKHICSELITLYAVGLLVSYIFGVPYSIILFISVVFYAYVVMTGRALPQNIMLL